jgi:hypothetical protein
MSGFGAMARQAEYLAATNAKHRQVSRDAEEQKPPPKLVPISLSDFMKVQQTSRNKGAKAWKPLTLDDMGEASDDQVFEDFELGSPISLTQTRLARETKSPFRNQPKILMGEQQIIKINLPENNIPTGLGAVTDARDQSSFLANLVPQRVLQHPIINLPLQSSLQSAPNSAYNGGFHTYITQTNRSTFTHRYSIL